MPPNRPDSAVKPTGSAHVGVFIHRRAVPSAKFNHQEHNMTENTNDEYESILGLTREEENRRDAEDPTRPPDSTTTVRITFEGQAYCLFSDIRKFLDGRSGRKPRLTPDQANAIRRRAKQGERAAKLASDYGVSRETIQNVLRGKTYRDGQQSA
jgi:hypothetical protein